MSDGIEINTYYELYCQCKLERDLLKEELQATREQLEKAEKVINELIEAMPHYVDCSLIDDENADCDCWKESDIKVARQYFKQKDEVKQ